MSIDEQKFKRLLESELAGLFGQLTGHFGQRLDTFEHEAEARFGQLYMMIDTCLKRLDTDETERAAMNHQLDRHEQWINTIANDSGTVLSAP